MKGSNWISVKDRLPKGKVLVCYLEPFFGLMTQEIGVGYYDNPDDYEDGSGGGWLFWRDNKKIVGGGVTHWMECPDMQPIEQLPGGGVYRDNVGGVSNGN